MSAAIWRQQGRCVDKSAAFDIGMVVPCFTFIAKKITSYTDAHIRWVCYGTACCCLRRTRPIIRLINKVCHDLLSNFLFKIALTVTVKFNFLQTICLRTLWAINVRAGYLTRLPTQDCDSYDDGPASVLSVRHWHCCWNHMWLQRNENLTSGLFVVCGRIFRFYQVPRIRLDSFSVENRCVTVKVYVLWQVSESVSERVMEHVSPSCCPLLSQWQRSPRRHPVQGLWWLSHGPGKCGAAASGGCQTCTQSPFCLQWSAAAV